MPSIGEYQTLISELIKKQMIMLGPAVAISRAKKVLSLTVDPQGQVTAIATEGGSALEDIYRQFFELSGQITKDTLLNLLENYPEIKKRHLQLREAETVKDLEEANQERPNDKGQPMVLPKTFKK